MPMREESRIEPTLLGISCISLVWPSHVSSIRPCFFPVPPPSHAPHLYLALWRPWLVPMTHHIFRLLGIFSIPRTSSPGILLGELHSSCKSQLKCSKLCETLWSLMCMDVFLPLCAATTSCIVVTCWVSSTWPTLFEVFIPNTWPLAGAQKLLFEWTYTVILSCFNIPKGLRHKTCKAVALGW